MYNQFPQVNPYQPRQNQYATQANSSIIWVQGIEGAKAYQMIPNSIVQLMDSDNDGIFYIKVSDNIGMSTLRVFKYQEIEQTQKPQEATPDLSQYVRKDELQKLIAEMYAVKEEADEQPVSTAQSTKRKSIV